MAPSENKGLRQFLVSKYGIVLGVFMAIAAFLLIFEHRAHIPGGKSWLIFLLLGGCIVMHLFMHGGHGGHGDVERPDREK